MVIGHWGLLPLKGTNVVSSGSWLVPIRSGCYKKLKPWVHSPAQPKQNKSKSKLAPESLWLPISPRD